jgi:tetratricopeptide (TPR) repeat protein/Flp pilus assembly secretin CpaC
MNKIRFPIGILLYTGKVKIVGFFLLGIMLLTGLNCSGIGGSSGNEEKAIEFDRPAGKGTVVLITDLTDFSDSKERVIVAGLSFVTDQANINWKEVRLIRNGNASDSDISTAKIYLDNGDQKFDGTTDNVIGIGSFKQGVAEVKIQPQILSEKPKNYFILTDVNPTADPQGDIWFNIKIDSEVFFKTSDPRGVISSNLPFLSRNTKIGNLAENQPAKNWKEIVNDREKEKTIKQQENEVIAQKYYETALKLYKEANYQQALENTQKALQYNPHHLGAEKLLIDIRRMLFGARSDELKTVLEDAQSRLTIKLQQLETEVRDHFLKAEQYMKDEKYKEAIYEYEQVEEKLKWDPYGFQSVANYRKQAQERTKIANERLLKNEKMNAVQQRRAAEEIIRIENERKRKEFNEKVKQIFEQTVVNFEARRYKEAEKLADKILDLVPNFKPAMDIKNDCLYAQHKKVQEDYLKLKVQNWKIMQEDFEESLIPYSGDQLIRYDKETWQKISKREPAGLTDKSAQEDPELLMLKRTLETVKENIVVTPEHAIQEQLDFIAQRYNMVILYGDGVREAFEEGKAQGFSLTNLPLGIALKYTLPKYGLTYMLKEKALWIVKQSDSTSNREIKIYNVDDLINPTSNFEPPAIETVFPGPTGNPFPPPPAVTLPQKPAMPIEDLIGLIKKNVMPDSWPDSPNAANSTNVVAGAQVAPVGVNKIMVIQTPQIQKEVTEFLKLLRTFEGTMISIQANFLSVTDDFLQDMGVQLRGDTTQNTGMTQYDVQGPGGGIAGFRRLGQMGTGAGTYDLRFRAEYPFVNSAGVADSAAQLSGRLANTGGLGLQYTFLGRNQMNYIAKMLEKKEKAVMIDSPRIMALNAQRSYVIFLREFSYIKDLDAISGVLAYDPIMDTLQLGIILDVMPVMSYDRKYVTLHTLPTFYSFQSLREYTIGIDANDGRPYQIEMPWVRVQRARTTVIVPDKGTVLLGGMKIASDIDLSMGTPMLNKLPLVGNLFKRRSHTTEKENLLIMMKAEIVELPEAEKEMD